MENLSQVQVLLAWAVVIVPFILFDIAAIKWGVYTSGDRGRLNSPDLK